MNKQEEPVSLKYFLAQLEYYIMKYLENYSKYSCVKKKFKDVIVTLIDYIINGGNLVWITKQRKCSKC